MTTNSLTSLPIWMSAVDTVSQAKFGTNGSLDYMSLFQSSSDSISDMSAVSGFVVTGQFISYSTDAQLRQVFSYLASHNISLVLNLGMLNQVGNIGVGVEGYAGPAGVVANILNRVKSLGGTVASIDMDEPLYFGHFYTGKNSEQQSIDTVAREVAANVAIAKSIFPNVQIGSTESSLVAPGLNEFLQDYKQYTGQSLAYLDTEVVWQNGQDAVMQNIAQTARANGTSYGVIYEGQLANATTSQQWTAIAEQRMVQVEANPLIRPDRASVDTWSALPTYLLPDTQAGTLSWLLAQYTTIAPLLRDTTPVGVKTGLWVPLTTTTYAGVPIALRNLYVTAQGATTGDTPMAVVLVDVSGTLSATAQGHGTVSGAGTNGLELTGTLSEVNAELATVTYTGSAVGKDTIEVGVSGGSDASAAQQINVTIAAASNLFPVAADQLSVAYQTVTGHSPDTGAMSVMQANVDSGTAQAAQATLLDQAQADITAIYQQALNRVPSSSELTTQAQKYLTGTSLGTIRTSLATSAEATLRLTTAYKTVLGQTLTSSQVADAEARVASGAYLLDVEGSAYTQALSAITGLFQQVLGRAPDPSGLANFAWAYLIGASLTKLQQQMATSAEATSNLNNAYQKAMGKLPDAATLAALQNQLASGVALKALTASFSALGGTTLVAGTGIAAGTAAAAGTAVQFAAAAAVQTAASVVTAAATTAVASAGISATKVADTIEHGADTTAGQASAQINASTLGLPDAHAHYVIVNNNGAPQIQDTATGGTVPVAIGVNTFQFSDGTGLFDSTGLTEDVARLYHAAFNRAPDLSGLQYWAQQASSGTPLPAISASFAASPEFVSSNGSLDDAGYVARLYQNVLGRAPDAAGAQSWTNALANGATRGDVLLGFANSAENIHGTQDTTGNAQSAEAYRLYRAVFNRTPDSTGLDYWTAQLQNGATPSQVAQAFVASQEFQATYQGLGPSGFITQLYANVLGRAPDAAGLEYWTDRLAGGASQADAVLGFSDSVENRMATSAATHDSWVFLPAQS